MKPVVLAITGLVLLVSACASRPDAIAPAPVSAAQYQPLSCDETTALLHEKQETLAEISKKQNRVATADAVGVFLIFLPFGTLAGGDSEEEVAAAKGEVAALQETISLNCPASLETAAH